MWQPHQPPSDLSGMSSGMWVLFISNSTHVLQVAGALLINNTGSVLLGAGEEGV